MKVANKNFTLMVYLSPKIKKCKTKQGETAKPVIVISAKLMCNRSKIQNFRNDFWLLNFLLNIFDRNSANIERKCVINYKSGTALIRIGPNKKRFHVFTKELTQGKGFIISQLTLST